MVISVKKLTESAQIPYKKHESDFCYDIVATKRKWKGLFFWEYECGLAMQIDRQDEVVAPGVGIFGNFGECLGRFRDKIIPLENSNIRLSIDIRPRSSIKDTGFVLCNSTGTIDEEYTGPIKFYFYHVLPWKRPYRVGDRIGQMKVGFTVPIEFVEVEELDKTDRGSDGFGSTGK